MPAKTRNLKTCLIAGTVTILSTALQAGGLSNVVDPVAPRSAPATDWSGLYGGVHVSLPTVDATVLDDTGDGIAAGVHGGYLFDLGQLVLGAEADVNLTAVESFTDDFPLSTIATFKLRGAYDAGNFLPYVAFGASQARLAGDVDAVDTGSFAGVGVDYRLTDRTSIGAEIAHYRYPDFAGTGDDFDVSATAVRLTHRF